MLVWLGLGAVGGQRLGQLSALQENDSTAFLDASAESSLARAEAAPFQDGSSLPVFVVLTRSTPIAPADMAAVRPFLISLGDAEIHPGTRLVDVLTTPPAALIPSEDGRALLIPVSIKADLAGEKLGNNTVTRLVIDTIRAKAQDDLSSYGLAVTGPAAYVADFGKAFAGIDGILLVVALAVVFVILVLVYRSPFLPIAVLLSAVFGLSAAGFAVYELTKRGWLSVSGQSQGILSILVVGAATDYALLVVSRFREELGGTDSTWTAMKRTWRGTVEPISASAATVVAGLLCLLLSNLKSTNSLGPISALGIVGALLGALTFLPAVLLLTGRRIFWPRVPKVESAVPTPVGRRGIAPAERETGWERVAGFVGRHPRRVWIGATALLIVMAAFAGTFKATGLGNDEVFRISVDSVSGERVLTEHFPAGTTSPATIVVAKDRADQVIEAVRGLPGVTNVARAQQGPQPKEVDGAVLLQVTLADQGQSRAAQDEVVELRRAVHEVDPALHVGGQTAQTLDTRLANERDMRVVLPAIAGVVFLVLVVLLRSLVAPLVLMTANIGSFLATIGVSALVFNHVFRFPNSDPSTPIYAFVFLIALGIDYSIFLMTRVREEVPRLGAQPAVLKGLSVTGGVITSAGVVLAATFAALFVIPLVFMAQIAFLVAFGVLLDTFVVRSLLVSGCAYDLGRRVWWPGRLARSAQQGAPHARRARA